MLIHSIAIIRNKQCIYFDLYNVSWLYIIFFFTYFIVKIINIGKSRYILKSQYVHVLTLAIQRGNKSKLMDIEGRYIQQYMKCTSASNSQTNRKYMHDQERN